MAGFGPGYRAGIRQGNSRGAMGTSHDRERGRATNLPPCAASGTLVVP